MGLVAVLSFGTGLVSLVLLKKHPFHPLLLYLLVWGFVTGLWSLDQIWIIFNYYQPSVETWIIIGASHLAFMIGSLAAVLTARIVMPQNPEIPLNEDPGALKKQIRIAYLLFFLSLSGYLRFIAELINYVDFGQGLAAAFKLWNEQTSGINELTFFGGFWGRLYVLPGIAILYNIYILKDCSGRRLRLLLITLLEVCFLIAPRRAYLIQTLTAALIMACFRYRKHLYKIVTLAVAAAGSLAVFFAYTQAILQKAGSFREGLKAIYLYITGNIPALEFQLQNIEPTSGLLVFNVFFKTINDLGLFPLDPDLSINFVNIPAPYNTIPYFYYSIVDFHLAGSLIVTGITAFMITFFYYRYRNADTFPALFVLSYLVVFIIYSFREHLLITYNTWFYFLVAVFVGAAINQRRFRKKKGDLITENA